MFRKTLYIFLALCISLCIFIACDNGVAFVNEMKEDTSSGGGGGSTLIPITVTANPQSKFLGDPDPDFGQDYKTSPDPLPSGVSITGVMTREAGEEVNVYAITQGTLALTGKNASKYTLSFTGSSLTIAEKDVVTIIVKDALGKFEGEDDPLFTYEAGAFLVYPGVEALALRGLTISGALAREAGEVAGTYAFNQGTITLNGETAGEYNLVFANIPGAVFTIAAPGAITVTPDNLEKHYNDVDPALTYTFTPMLPAGVEFTGALSRVAGEDVGEYAIIQNTLALTGTGAGNYYIDFDDTKKLTISKIPVTVTADSFTRVKGEAFPDLTFTNDRGLLVSDFTGTLSCTAADTSTTGTFPITRGTLSITGAAANNYSFEDANFVAGNLVVTAKTIITVTPNNQTKYYGDPEPTYTFSFTPTPEAGVTFNPATSLGRTAGENVGTYAINAGNLALQGDKKDNYIISVVNGKTLTISKKSVAITAYDRNKEYSDADPELTFGSNPSLPPAAFTGSLAGTTVNTVPGSYDILRGSLELSTASDSNGRYIDNYEVGAFTKGTMTISKKSVTVTADAKTKVSNGTEPTLTYTSSPALPAAAFTGALTRAAGETVGQNYAITQGTLALSTNSDGNGQYKDNYDITTFNGANVTIINKQTVTIEATNNLSKYYSDSDPALTYSLAAPLPTGVTLTGSPSRENGENVGTYAITKGSLTLGGDPAVNYTINFISHDFTISKKTVTVTPHNVNKVQGGTEPDLTFTSSPSLPLVAFDGALARDAGDELGHEYAITQGTLALSTASDGTGQYKNNYALNFVEGSKVTIINKQQIAISATEGLSKYYGDSDPALTYSLAAVLPPNVTLSGSPGRTAGENVGTYAINKGTLTLGGSNAGNYEISFTSHDFTINKKTVIVTPDNVDKVKGGTEPDLTFTSSPSLPLAAFDGALTREAGEELGSQYAITQGTLALSTTNPDAEHPYSSNYNLSVASGSKVTIINKMQITIEATENQSKYYGDADPTLTYILAEALPLGVTLTGAPSRTAGENVVSSPYAINKGSLTLGGSKASNYEINFISHDFTINQKPVVITPDNVNKVKGGTEPELTFTSSPSLPAAAFTGSLQREAGDTLGSQYAISQDDLAMSTDSDGTGRYVDNYVISSVVAGSKVTIVNPGTITVTADNKHKYYGEDDPELTYTLAEALPAGVTISGSLIRVAGENVATSPYTINSSLSLTGPNASNYEISFTPGALTVYTKTVKVTANPQSKLYKDAVPALTYSSNPTLPAAAFTGSLACAGDANSNVGTYAITKGTLALSTATDGNGGQYNENYTYDSDADFTGSTLTINKRTVYVTADDKSKTYGDVDPALTFATSPHLPAAAFSGSLVRVAGEATGDYAIHDNDLALVSPYSTNYEYDKNENYTPGTFTITEIAQANISITFFRSIVQSLYDANDDVTAFGRSTTPPAGEYFSVDDVKIWYDDVNHKIAWYYGHNVPKIVKFRAGSMANFFKDCDKYLDISLEGFDTSLVTNMAGLFQNCANLQTVDLTGIETGAVTNMANMFYKAGYNYIPKKTSAEGGDPSKMTDNTNNLAITKLRFDTSSVTDMSYMFNLCSANNLCTPTDPLDDTTKPTNLSEWDTSSVTDMNHMFAGWYGKIESTTYYIYSKFGSLDVTNWNTTSCTDFSYMFDYCNRLTSLDISGSNWSFAAVTNIERMFDRCESLTSLTFPSYTDLSNVTNMCFVISTDDKLSVSVIADIIATWDIDSCSIDFIDYGTSDETPNRLYKGNGKILSETTNARREFCTYGHNTPNVYFGGKGTGVNANDAQRMVLIP